MDQAAGGVAPACFVRAVFIQHAAGLFDGQVMPAREVMDILLGHSCRTRQAADAFRQMSLRIVASAPPSISHFAPLT